MTGRSRVTEFQRTEVLLPEPWSSLSFPSQIETFDNGLTVIAHRDRKAPIVAVYVAYRAGSRDEPAGKSGLAHLYEHLMYCGTKRFPGNTFRHLERIGATSINAISREDYTAFFESVPKDSLDQALAIEAHRMEENCFDRTEFERQREVVRNELLQREGEPYGSINRRIAEQSYPAEHPYSHPADGTIPGLERLSIDDAQSWYRTHYRPDNAVIVVAGDIAPQAAIERVYRHFGKLQYQAAAPEQTVISAEKPKRSKRITVEERTSSDRIYLVWNVPPFATEEYARLELLVEILGGGEDSWLSQRLINEADVATVIGAEARPHEYGSQIVLRASARVGVSLKRLREEVERAVERLAGASIAKSAIDHARTRLFARWTRDTERLCGPRSRVELLGTSWIMSCDRHAHEKRLARIVSASAHELRTAASSWLSTPLIIEARGALRNRAGKRARGDSHDDNSLQRVALPNTERTLSPVRPIVIRRPGSPTCAVHLVIEGGSKDDPEGRSGTAAVTLAALADQTLRRSHRTIAQRLERLNGSIEVRTLRDACVIRLSSPAADADEATELLRELLDRRFIEDGLVERGKARQLGAILAEKSRPFDLAMRLMPSMLFGRENRYVRPPSGVPSEVAQITVEQVAALISRWRLESARRVSCVGPQKREALISLGERLGAASRTTKAPVLEAITPLPQSRVVVVHAPERKQTAVFASRAIPARSHDSFAAIAAADTIFGGSFSSRLNMNLREDKGWCYGAHSVIATWRTAGLWTAYTVVEPERTVESMSEIEREWRHLRDVTSLELNDAVAFMTKRVAGELETTAQIATAAEELIIAGLPRSWYRELQTQLHELRPSTIAKALEPLNQRRFAWVILGDVTSLVPAIERAGFGTVEVIGEPDSIP